MLDTICPDEAEIARLAHGDLPDSDAELLIRHIETCAECSATVETYSRNGDRLVDQLRSASSLAIPEDQDCVRLLERLRQIDVAHVLAEAYDAEPDQRKQVRDYRISEKLGEGGMGVVYKAIHTRMDKTVALKMLSTRHLARRGRVKRFEREVKAIAKLEHPNIVRATDAGEEKGVPFLAMEYVEGEDLSTIVKQSGPLNPADASEIIRQAAIGLQFAHDQRLIHRDVKPSNLMLTCGGQCHLSAISGYDPAQPMVKILDLGLARLMNDVPADDGPRNESASDASGTSAELSRDGLILGTVDYMAPEQALDGSDVDERSDIYSLGCTLFFLLSGTAPFHVEGASSTLLTLSRHQTETPPPLSEFRRDVPRGLESVVLRMIAKSRDERYSNMSEVAEALAPFAAEADLYRINPSGPLPEPRTNPAALPDRATRPTGPASGRFFGIGWGWWGVTLLVLLAGVSLYEITTVQRKTADGEFEVRFDDDQYFSEVEGETITLKSIEDGKSHTLKLSARRTAVPMSAGTYEIVVALDSGLEIVGGRQVTVNAGEKRSVVARFIPSTEVIPPEAESVIAHRRAAERVLELNGTVMVQIANGDSRDVADVDDLPTEPFELKYVVCRQSSFQKADVELLAGLTSISYLNIFPADFDDETVQILAGLTNCEDLCLSGPAVHTEGVRTLLQAYPRISGLNLSLTTVDAEIISTIATMPGMKNLFLPKTISVSEMSPLERLPGPLYLEVHRSVTDADMRQLSRIPAWYLSLVCSETFTGDGLVEFSGNGRLTRLSLISGRAITPESFRHLGMAKNMQTFFCTSCELTAEKLAAICTISQLKTLSINDGQLRGEDLRPIGQLKNLVSLNLYGIVVEDDMEKLLREMLPDCQIVIH